MTRSFILVSASSPEDAAHMVADSPEFPDLCLTSPSQQARETAEFAFQGRWVFTLEEPLLAARNEHEDGGDVLARLAVALRSIAAYDAKLPFVVVDKLDVLGATAFQLDELGLARLADDIDRLVPLP
jgi:broad specificity phosphatase PhoE